MALGHGALSLGGRCYPCGKGAIGVYSPRYSESISVSPKVSAPCRYGMGR